MTPRILLLTAVALAVVFCFAFLFGEPSAFAQPDDLGEGPVVGAVQPEQEEPRLIITTSHPITAGITAFFTATVTVAPETYTYTWAFGDGSTFQGRFANHIYQTPGVYRVSVIATRNGQRLEASVEIDVKPTPPPAPIKDLTCTQNGPVEANNPVRLVAAVAEGEPATYSWMLGYPGSPRLEGAVVTHRYPEPGFYQATVTAHNPVTSQPATCTTDPIVVLDETIAGLDFTWKTTPSVEIPVEFEVKTERGTRIEYQWFFGDGKRLVVRDQPTAINTYEQRGLYEVTVVATNSRSTMQRTRTVVVMPQAPESIQGSNDGPKPVNTSLTANVSVTSRDPITSFTWRWGDGTFAQTTAVPFHSHRYARAGAFGIQVIARNEAGAVAHSQIAYIGIEGPLSTLRIEHGFSGNVMLPAGQPVTLTVTFDPPRPGDRYEDFEYVWDWGDGPPTHSRTPRLGHTYFSSNNYVVRVTATQVTPTTPPIQLYGATVVLVAPNLYFPLVVQNAGFVTSPADRLSPPTPTSSPTPTATATGEVGETEEPPLTPEETPVPLPSPPEETPSPTPTATAIDPPPIPPTAPPTATSTPTPTEAEEPPPTATPTSTQTPVEGGTIPPLPG